MAQAITHVVRGEDPADNTPRQMLLQHALGVPTPRYLHTRWLRTSDGEKLSNNTARHRWSWTTHWPLWGQAVAVLRAAATGASPTTSPRPAQALRSGSRPGHLYNRAS